MKTILFYAFSILTILGCRNVTTLKTKVSNDVVRDSLHTLKYQKEFFMLKDYLANNKGELSKNDYLYFEAILHHVFLNYEESHSNITKIADNKFTGLDSASIKYLINTDINNLKMLGRYSEGFKLSLKMFEEFSHMMDSTDFKVQISHKKTLQVLQDYKPISVQRNGDINIPTTRDKANLLNLDVTVGDSVLNLVFDTGAEACVLQKSIAEAAGMKIIKVSIPTTWGNGNEVPGDIAIADKIIIGSQIIENVPFLIFEDSIMTYPEYDYKINGIIGFPILQAFEEIHFTSDNRLVVPQFPKEYTTHNLYVEDLKPVVQVLYNGDYLLFGYDTGARKTSLHSKYYKKHKNLIDSTYQLTQTANLSGGGTTVESVYNIDSLKISIAGSEAYIKNTSLHFDNLGPYDYVDGNLGQDYMSQFDKMIVSFKHSSLLFE